MSAWFKCFPERILASYDKLDSDQRAAAYTLTMLIYKHDEPLRLSELYLAGACGFTLRKYRRVLGELLALGKFYIAPSGAIGNELADELLEHRRSSRETGRAGGKKRAANAAAKSRITEMKPEATEANNSKDFEKAHENNTSNQGSLGFALNHKEVEISEEAKASSAGVVPVSHWDLCVEAICAQTGKAPGTERGFLGLLLKDLNGHGGDAAMREIITDALTKDRADLKAWLRDAVRRRKVAPPTISTRPTIALCRLGDLSWDHDWVTQENWIIENGERRLLGRPLTPDEQAVVNRAVDRNLGNRRAA